MELRIEHEFISMKYFTKVEQFQQVFQSFRKQWIYF